MSAVPSDFVFIKATEGVGYVSPACNAQTASAQKVGKKVGWYHFANVGNAVQQADYFVNNISNYVHHGILMLDWEANAVYQGVGWAKAWLDHVYQRTGVRPIIYMSKGVVHQYDWSPVASDYGLFFAQYANYNRTGYQADPWTDNKGLGSWKSAVAFQYSSSGRLAGWAGNLDLDKFYGDKSTWDAYAKSDIPAVKFAYKVGQFVTVKDGQSKNAVGYDISKWVGAKIEIVKTRVVNGKSVYDGKVGANPYNDLLESNIQIWEEAPAPLFKVGDQVQISPKALKERNGYDLAPRRLKLGTVAKATKYAVKYSRSWYEYEVYYTDGKQNTHVLEQDLTF
ncbi:GH25 family lysozyme [Oenococcus alcoholitolerans]|uniref:GH25 family lysozyme n=1 Tax=Oenococcus alcoholitolerans TaxID=931074 RepID=UPI003F70983A